MVQVKRIFIKIFYHIRYKYYQFKNLIKHFPLGKEEEVGQYDENLRVKKN